MDMKLVAWARAVKSRRRWRPGLPPLWLFTDAVRSPDVLADVDRLPPGLCGVVLRHGDRALARAVARRCRTRRLVLVTVAARLLPGVGRHLRRGRGRSCGGTSSAHNLAELVRSARAGCSAAFLSPVFITASHPGARATGVTRWAAMARQSTIPVLALGGIDGRRALALPRWVAGVGAIRALLG